MTYSVKGGKLARWPKLGEAVFIDYGTDQIGRWWWRSLGEHGGPSRTQAEARKNSTDAILGPQCEIAARGTRLGRGRNEAEHQNSAATSPRSPARGYIPREI
jgi:hypothetical protein